MQNAVTLQEYRSPIWKYLLAISLLTAGIFFIAYLSISDPLWTGIFRLIAFAGAAGSVILFLKIRQKIKTIKPEVTSEHLIIRYLIDGKEIKEEMFDRDTIKIIERKEATTAWDFMSGRNTYKHIISFTDTGTTLNIFIYSGQDITLTKEDSVAFEKFLNTHHVPFSG